MWFTGTSTGNRYNVGQSYSMAGDVYTARADGTFQNERTGRATVGSSREVAAAGLSGLTGGGPGNSRVATAPVASQQVRQAVARQGESPSSAAVKAVPNGAQSGGASANLAGARAADVAEARARREQYSNLRLADLPPRKFPKSEQQLYLGTYAVPHINVSDGGVAEERYGDLGGAIWGVGVLGADGVVVASDMIVRGAQAAGWNPVQGAVDFAGYLDTRKEALGGKSVVDLTLDAVFGPDPGVAEWNGW